MYLVKINRKTKDWDVRIIKKGEPFDLGHYNPEKHDIYIAKEISYDKLVDRLEREYMEN